VSVVVTIVILLVGLRILLKLVVWIERLIWSPVTEGDWHRQYAEDVLTWLLKMYPIRKKRPIIVIDDSSSELLGEYHYYINVIIIYSRNNQSIKDVLQTTIHEFFHFYLITSEVKMDLYVRQLIEHGVHDHPQEVLCEAMEKVLVKRYLREFQ
jgi:hypothetical protein